MSSSDSVEDRAIGGTCGAAIMLGAVVAGPIVLFTLSGGEIMRIRELFWLIGPIHVWGAAVIGVGAATGATLGRRRLIELGKHLVALEPGRPWITLALWTGLIGIIIITTALYGQHAL